MKITLAEKDNIFAIMNEYFNFPLRENTVYGAFNDYDLYSHGFTYESGASKYCIMHDDFGDYVVKFCTEKFDWCEREYTNYLAAVENHVEEFFPYTDYLGTIDGIKFYVQEMADCDSDEIHNSWYDKISSERISEGVALEDEDCECDTVNGIVEDLEDEERIDIIFNSLELATFIHKYHINDLHEGNFGFIDGRPVIIDFSGYGRAAKERSLIYV